MSKTDRDTHLLAEWADSLQASLQPDGPPRLHAPQAPGLRADLLARVAASAAAHREYLTVRREATPWLPLAPGVGQRLLRQDAAVEVAVLALQDGAALPAAPAGCAQELLLVEGALVRHDADGEPVLPLFSHAVVPPPVDAAGPSCRARGSASVYRRLLRLPAQDLPELQAQWWQSGFRAYGTRGFAPPPAWVDASPGVQVMPLRAKGAVVSMLVRFEAGARVPDHGHAIDEDCLVLQGEMFLGDILLRSGDYQLAPAGGSHFDENSDVGVCFYFHGALDDALRGGNKP